MRKVSTEALSAPPVIKRYASEHQSVFNFMAAACGRLVATERVVHLANGPVSAMDDRDAIRAAVAAGEDPHYETYGPSIGGLATYSIGSDSYAYTVIDVSETGHTVTLQRRRARGSLTYENPEGLTVVVTRRKTLVGIVYREKGLRCGSVAFGAAWERMDSSF